MHDVQLYSVSYDEDAALWALSDLAQAVTDWSACRVVGGHMVSLHVAIAGADVEHRPTGDADLAAPVEVLGDPALASALEEDLSYEKISGNRLKRDTGTGEAVVDLLAPARTTRTRHNVKAGKFTVDAYSALHYALATEPAMVSVRVTPFDGGRHGPFVVAIPALEAAIVIKARAARPKDRIDIDRLLHVANHVGATLPPPSSSKDVRLATQYLHGPYSRDADEQLRLVIEQVVPRPEDSSAFRDL